MARKTAPAPPRTKPTATHFSFQAQYPNKPGMLAQIATAVAECGGSIGDIDVDQVDRHDDRARGRRTARDSTHAQEIVDHVKATKRVLIKSVADRVYLSHRGGKIEIRNKVPVTRGVTSPSCTPRASARVCLAIDKDPKPAYSMTIKGNTIAVVSDGTRRSSASVISARRRRCPSWRARRCSSRRSVASTRGRSASTRRAERESSPRDREAIAPGFGGINLEDISAPRCFYIEERLKKELDIPVFHDDQHGTAVVVLAALLNALRIVQERAAGPEVVVLGVERQRASRARNPHGGGREEHHRLQPRGHHPQRPCREHELHEGVVRRQHEPRSCQRHRQRRDGRRGPLPRRRRAKQITVNDVRR